MVQVDVFWSYGLASGLALAARGSLRKMTDPWSNKYFTCTVLWTALVFAPSGMYLLWAFPYWETMFLARSYEDIPAWLVSVFAATNISQAVLGHYVTWRLLRSGRDRAAWMQPVWSHGAMLFILFFGWDGSGFTRFSYAGTGEDWAKGVAYPWTAFFESRVFYALLGMAVVFIPSYFGLVVKWLRESPANPRSRPSLAIDQRIDSSALRD